MRRTLTLAIAAGLFLVVPASSARAQVSYGYDSLFYGLPSGASYWYSSGYTGMYTDPSTASFAGNTTAPFRAVAPYGQPPFASFSRSDGLSAALSPGATAQPATRPVITMWAPPSSASTIGRAPR